MSVASSAYGTAIMVDHDKADSGPDEATKPDTIVTKIFGDYEVLKPIGKGKYSVFLFDDRPDNGRCDGFLRHARRHQYG